MAAIDRLFGQSAPAIYRPRSQCTASDLRDDGSLRALWPRGDRQDPCLRSRPHV